MKILTWVGALVICVAVAFGTSSVLRGHQANTSAAVTATTLFTADGGDLPHSLPAPRAAVTPAPHRVATPTAPKVAPKAAPKAAPVTRSASAPAIVIGSRQQALINQDRARYGLRPLTWSSCLATIAYSNAVRMANQGYISHTNGATRDLGCHLGNHAGENIGWYSAGINDTWANNAFMASPDHRANILSSYYHYVATYWVRASNGKAYIAVEFS
jgi:uncharacterized protein YkwD